MNILGVGPGELMLIMIILLVVVGPERLPGLARQGGQMLVRVRNWVQKSPDAAMIMRARQEIEQELASLRSSLLEVQNARDEVIQAAKQVNKTFTEDIGGAFKEVTDTINKDGIQAVKQSASDAIKAANTATQAAESAADAAASAADSAGVAAPANSVLADGAADVASNGQSIVRGRSRQASFGSQRSDATPTELLEQLLDNAPTDALPPVADFDALSAQIQNVLDQMQALQAELRQRGLLDADWQQSPGLEDAAVEDAAVEDAAVEDAAEPRAAESHAAAGRMSNGTPHAADEPQFATSTETISEEQLQ